MKRAKFREKEREIEAKKEQYRRELIMKAWINKDLLVSSGVIENDHTITISEPDVEKYYNWEVRKQLCKYDLEGEVEVNQKAQTKSNVPELVPSRPTLDGLWNSTEKLKKQDSWEKVGQVPKQYKAKQDISHAFVAVWKHLTVEYGVKYKETHVMKKRWNG